ncbi:hypothetical protein EJ05DRAFT_185949 [Pseudovirgaria hyperparasitica]|uniref:Arrestin-like N-terminal domain-containing protein n=1 Tax=Pseudovirgaria hyperparasitica TaxID=470096 RepID=A0A6A6WID2_9PEZI|nr:uncharacterized protein EJ05DRAFT_185949 [Pseudovirgaria hyperparasitica]KAF2761824.1 hypothetical protein EJ05DRAFT_185949 [Pseudovirgaria hyperparasitica]
MATVLNVTIHGDPCRIYHPADKITGTVYLTTSSQEEFKQLKLNFRGQCKTTTTRPYYVSGNEHSLASRKMLKETVTLFDQEKVLFQGPYKMSPTQHEWHFEYTFPSKSETTYQKAVKSAYYNKHPHDLPPSFRCLTESYRGEGYVHYSIEATLVRGSFKSEVRNLRYLLFRRRSERPTPAKSHPNVLESQQIQMHEDFRPRVDKFGKAIHYSTLPVPTSVKFTPTFYAPKAVAPKQVIDLGLSIKQIQDQVNCNDTEIFTVDRLRVELLTTTRVACRGVLSQTQDVVTRSVTCVDRKLPGISIPIDDTPIALTRGFRLTDNNEASPSFKSYSISRIYQININIWLRWRDQTFRLSTSIELDILPRYDPPPPRRQRRSVDAELVDPLPLYTRTEHAPAYEEVAPALARDVREQRLLFERTFSESQRDALLGATSSSSSSSSSGDDSSAADESSDDLYTSDEGSATPPTPFLSRVSSAVIASRSSTG